VVELVVGLLLGLVLGFGEVCVDDGCCVVDGVELWSGVVVDCEKATPVHIKATDVKYAIFLIASVLL